MKGREGLTAFPPSPMRIDPNAYRAGLFSGIQEGLHKEAADAAPAKAVGKKILGPVLGAALVASEAYPLATGESSIGESVGGLGSYYAIERGMQHALRNWKVPEKAPWYGTKAGWKKGLAVNIPAILGSGFGASLGHKLIPKRLVEPKVPQQQQPLTSTTRVNRGYT